MTIDTTIVAALIALLGVAVSAAISALVALHLVNKNFEKQRILAERAFEHQRILARDAAWWQKKAESYSRIVEELSYLHYYTVQWMGDELGERNLSEETKAKLQDRYEQVRESIVRATAMGSYIVSNEAVRALDKLRRQLDYEIHEPTAYEQMDREYEAVQECLESIRKYAKADLHGEYVDS